MAPSEVEIRAAKNNNKDYLLQRANAVSVGVGRKNDTDELCLVVGVSKKVPEDQLDKQDVIPSQVDGIQTDVQEIGEIVPELLLAQEDRKRRHRPVPQGVSIGHPDVTAGSAGWMYETDEGEILVGSNNHVMADINQAEVGDPILQPGTADGGSTSEDEVATLSYYTPIESGVTVDLAVASMSATHKNALLGVDKPITGVVDKLSVGDELVKSGRTTGVLRAEIQQLNASVRVNYGDAGTIEIEDCIITGDMSDGGDSGSSSAKEVNGELRAAGRVFAGSSSATVHHSIKNEIGILQEEYDSSIRLMTDQKNDTPTASVSLVMQRAGPGTGKIEATVEDDEGTVVQGSTVTISGEVEREGVTDSKGYTEFDGVPIGDYTVISEKPDSNLDPATVEITASKFE